MDATTLHSSQWFDLVRNKVDALRFGSLQINVHDGKVVQIESVERTRLSVPVKASGGGFDAYSPRETLSH